jgi:hypothetical protein
LIREQRIKNDGLDVYAVKQAGNPCSFLIEGFPGYEIY